MTDKVLNSVLKQTQSAMNMAEQDYENMDKGTPAEELKPKFAPAGTGSPAAHIQPKTKKKKKPQKMLERLKLSWEVM